MKISKGTGYFDSYEAARVIRDLLRGTHPEARIVHYTLGYAIQYRKSGSYWPTEAHNSKQTLLDSLISA